jgi:glycosyltransferase involved in cell wall biosynthesis
MRVGVVIPVHNEESSISQVISEIPRDVVDIVIVGANLCTDRSEERAQAAGAVVVAENRRGYGWACQAAIDALPPEIDTLVFVDGDAADDPSEIPLLLEPLDRGFDLVIGSRVLGERQRGSLSPQSRIGNLIAVTLIRWLYGFSYTDLGPFRAVRREVFDELRLKEFTYGWTVELQVKAVQCGYNVKEVPVSYRRRIGQSKVSGTVRGVIGAGWGILATIFKLGLARQRKTEQG